MLMQTVRAPVSHPVEIGDLRPTQITIGLRDAQMRAAKIKARVDADSGKVVRKTVIPVVSGPKNNYYVIDHHHLSRASLLAGLTQVSVVVVLNLGRLDKDAFWVFMDNRGLVHPYDENGKRCDYTEIPKSIEDLRDDPFRSLAGALRRKGGYAKDTTPFSEFLWADHLRRQLNKKDVVKDFEGAVKTALVLAKKTEADHLPGWCGPVVEE
jgi:hypothetical protein